MGPWIRLRLAITFLIFVAFFTLIAFRLVQLQVLVNPELRALAQRQYQKTGNKSSYREAILDRNGEELAVSLPAGSVFARPRLIARKRETARKLARLLGGTPQRWYSRLKTEKPFIWIQRQVSTEIAKKIGSEKIPGIFVEAENRRVYPNENLAANVIGFTDIDGNGLSGLELALNDELLRKGSRYQMLRDGKGNPSYIDRRALKPANENGGIYSTIDRRLQHALEEEIQAAHEKYGAKAVLAVVMDPRTGEIFALGQSPSFDPNRASSSPPQNLANRFVSHLYEPGSTMKVIFAAEAIDRGLMTRHTPIDCGNGSMMIGNKSIREADAHHRFGIVPLEKVIRFSSNVGAVKIVHHLGVDSVKHVLTRFGFVAKTEVGLPGEAASPLRAADAWTPLYLGTVGFGQGLAVTPLQMVTAFAPFANGGYRVRPKILLGELSPPGTPFAEKDRIISAATAQTMRDVLVSVTEEDKGTGLSARIHGLKVAGKTGTAQKYDPDKGYEGGKYFSSFIGFLPADQPELLIGVFVDEPQKNYYASTVAAPLFKSVAERSLQILDRIPKQMLARAEKKSDVFAAGTDIPVHFEALPDGTWVMPDLKGNSLKDSLAAVGPFFDRVKVSGSGYVESQLPKPGSPVTPDTEVHLQLSPQG